MDTTIGDRIRGLLQSSGTSQAQLAETVEMTPDALSRALNGYRGFGSLELARISETLDTDVHWLITGRPDPTSMTLAARCTYDHDSGTYANESLDDDKALLGDIRLAYVQAYPHGPASSKEVPTDPRAARAALGDDFVLSFAERLEQVFDIDVVRVAEVGTDYTLNIGDRHVIVLAAMAEWFRENWSLAHELGHIANCHVHDGDDSQRAASEAAANGFAAELLLPADEIGRVEWEHLSAPELGRFVWMTGVSNDALRRRLSALRVTVSDDVAKWLDMSTTVFLRRIALPAGRWRDLVERQRQAVGRRFPTHLTLRHQDGIEEGRLGNGTLAWMLGVPPAALEPPDEEGAGGVDLDELARSLGLAPA